MADNDTAEVGSGISALVRKQFLRPERSDLPATEALAFRHLLIRDAAYDGLPKANRAELHEGFANWLGETARTLGEQDEILGYHLEQAHRYRTELGPLDDRATELGRRAGEYLGDAGLRAFARDDMSASAGLLGRAVRVLPADHPRLPSLEGRLVTSLIRSEDLEHATEANRRHIEDARSFGDRAQEQRAELDALELRSQRSTQGVSAEDIRRIADRAIEVFEEVGDEEGLSHATQALSQAAWLNGDATEALAHAEASLEYAMRSAARISFVDPPTDISQSLFLGPVAAGEGFERLRTLAGQIEGDHRAEAKVKGDIAWFLIYLGRFEEARVILRQLSATWEELGDHWGAIGTSVGLGEIEWFSGHPAAAEESFRDFCNYLRGVGNDWLLFFAVTDLAELLVVLDREGEALEETNEILSVVAPGDVPKQARWREVRSVPLARLGRLDEAVDLVDQAEQMARSTDFLFLLAQTMRSKAEVLKLSGRKEEAAVAAREALALYEAKEFVPHIGWTRSLLDSLTA